MTLLTAPVGAIQPLVMPGPVVSLVARWNAVVDASGDRLALRSPGSSYTFAEADLISDIVAVRLVRGLPGDGSPIGALLDHAAASLIGYLSIVKTGRIAVMLDPHLPAERLRDIIGLSGMSVCLTDETTASAALPIGEPFVTLLRLDDMIREAEQAARTRSGDADHSVLAAGRARRGADAASIIFTSGSTGRPKGVIQTHAQLLNEAYGNGEGFRITPGDRVAAVLPFGFSAGICLAVAALLNGASLWCFDPREGGVRGLISWIDEQRLTTLHCTPHLLRSVVAALGDDELMPTLRIVSTVGEAINWRDVAALRPHVLDTCSFVNWSGSSEMGTLALYEIAGDAPLGSGAVPVGRAFANKEIVLLREDKTVAAPGEAGEIVAISDYLSGGYWKDDAQNAVRFSLNADGRRLCQQGDLGRFDASGDLSLLGRADAAVKVRGYLVEPSEIEASLLAIQGVTEVLVVPTVAPPAATRLTAYVVQESGRRAESPAALRRALREKLPEYMVPAAIVPLAALPRNERGKVDRAELPPVVQPEPTGEALSPWERVIADVWCDVLGLEAIGLDDDFMALGGDSLSAEELLEIVRQRFGVPFRSSDLLDAPTLREFTARVRLGKGHLPSHPDVVVLHPAGTRAPVFCFAGSGALALTFLPLSRHFADRGIYAFQAHGLERRAAPDWSVGASARRFLEIIRLVQPHGPYLLLGHSFGGLVALEIARMLSGAGETIELVGLLDTYLPRSAVAQQGPHATAGDAGAVPASARGVNGRLRATVMPSTLRRVRAAVDQQVQRVLPDGWPGLALWDRRAHAVLAGVVPYTGQRQFDAFFDHGVIASRRYHLEPYDGRVVIVLAERNPDGREAWEPLLTGPHAFVDIHSEHTSLLREPHATALATILLSHIGQGSA